MINLKTYVCVISLQGNYVLGSVAISSTTPIISIKLNVTSQPNANFTIPANSVINYGILPNESMVKSSEKKKPYGVSEYGHGRFDCATPSRRLHLVPP
jgi:hypothetical protein